MSMNTVLGLAAVAGLLLATAPPERASAMSLVNPAIAAAVQRETATGATEVRWHGRHHGWRRHYGWHRHHGYHHRRHWHRRHFW
ncbi:hypothetical protein [Tardiphaga sp.]|uniref:hypothetical protein n=1 Tax=Tardiphaga sp. TaxID=1926292 RepID=UPI0025D2DCF4|nr:hypothetical protein [Tardiphaga sp.]